MSDYKEYYSTFSTTTSNVQKQVIEDNTDAYSVLENLIGFHYWLHDEVASIYNDPNYYSQFVTGKFVHLEFGHNFLSLYSAFVALEHNLLHSAISLKRNVLESIVKMNYLAFFPSNICDVLFHDVINGLREESDKKQKLNSFVSHTKPSFCQTLTTDKILSNIKNKYYFKWLSKQIYAKQTTNSINSMYNKWSPSVHSSLLRPQTNYDKETTASELYDLQLLLFFNILAEVEGHGDMIKKDLFPYHKSKQFIDSILPLLRQNGRMISFFPDHPDIASKVYIHPPGAPWK